LATDPLKNFPGYALRRASAASMAALAEKLAALAVRPTEATVLMFIAANPGITQGEVARMLGMASANMTPLISRLEERDLIEREPVDGRSHGLNLSAAGRTFTNRIRKVINAHEESLLAKVPAAQRHMFMAALHNLWSDAQD
jgi:DNA-binding MarR family transcriptional regulator